MATTPHVSRRSILASVSATFAGTALAAAAPLSSSSAALASSAAIDPALVAIQECEDALQEFRRILHAEDYGVDDVCMGDVDDASDASLDAWEALFDVTPTTLVGAAALAAYMLKYHREQGGADTAEEALEGLAGGLKRFAAAAGQEGRTG